MKAYKRKVLGTGVLWLLLGIQTLCAQATVGDTVEQEPTRISLLTTSPSDIAIYTAWGHTAIRVKTPTADKVYNYGVFSFSDNFVYKFVKGETDYWLARESFSSAAEEARYKNAYMVEQVLNIPDSVAIAIKEALEENWKPKNKYYRYSFFLDNCATRPRDMIERFVDIAYDEQELGSETYRDIVHRLTKNQKGFQFGIDLCLGSETDQVPDNRALTFLPEALMESFAKAQIRVQGDTLVPLVKETRLVNEPVPLIADESILTDPVFIAWFTFIFFTLLTLLEMKKMRMNVAIDCVLSWVAGLVGCLVFFLTFISEHAFTNPNYNLLWINPLQLVFALLVPFKKLRWNLAYHQIFNLITVGVAIIGWWLLPQRFHPAFLPLMLLLAERSFFYIKRYKR